MKKLPLIIISLILLSCASNSSLYDKEIELINSDVQKRIKKMQEKIENDEALERLEECKKNGEISTDCYELQVKVEVSKLNRETRIEQYKLMDSYKDVKKRPIVSNSEEVSSNNESNNNEALNSFLLLLNNVINPEPFKIDTSLMDNLKSDLNFGKNLYNFTTPDQILIATPLISGAFNLELDIYNNVIVKDLISGKNYRGSLSINQDYIKFDNGMIGRVNSDGNFTFSNF